MAMNSVALAGEICDAMGFDVPSKEITAFAKGTVEGFQAGLCSFGGPPIHKIVMLMPNQMAMLIQGYAGYPSVSPQLLGYATGVCNHALAMGIVTYTMPPPILGVPNFFLMGSLTGLDGTACASLVQAAAGYPTVSTKLLKECTAVCTHLMANMEINSGMMA